jgi:hypothetical protein
LRLLPPLKATVRLLLSPRMGWGVPEGGEPFGKARDDLDGVDPTKKI